MRAFVFFILVALLEQHAPGQEILPQSLTEYRLLIEQRKLYKSMRVIEQVRYTYQIVNGNVTDTRQADQVTSYDKEGRPYEVKSIGEKSELLNITMFAYDSSGNNTGQKTFLPEGPIVHRVVNTFTGNLVQQTQIWNETNNTEKTINYSINYENNMVVSRYFAKANQLLYSFKFYFTNLNDGRISKVEKISEFNQLLYSTTYHYEVGLLDKKVFLTPAGSVAFVIKYTYDENGFLRSELKQTKHQQQVYKYIYDYNKAGLLLASIKYGRKNEVLEYQKFEYRYY